MDVGSVVDGKYRLVRQIGKGGMGSVWEVQHTRTNQRLALKLLHSDTEAEPQLIERFIQEAQAAAAIGSEHIIFVTDAGDTAAGTPYMVMEYLEGEDLAHIIQREGPMEPSRAANLILQACEGLDAAHRQGIIHRDVKPANLFVVRRADGSERVKVVDFGIAQVQDSTKQLTSTRAMLGTFFYMSPEQAESSKHVDARSDVYSLGVTLYEALSGQQPYQAESLRELVAKIMMGQQVQIDTVRQDLPAGLPAVVMKAVASDKEQRYSSMSEFAEALRAYVRHAASPSVPMTQVQNGSRPPATVMVGANQALPQTQVGVLPAPTLDRKAPRSRLPVFLAVGVVALLLLLAVSIGVLALMNRTEPVEQDRSEDVVAAQPSAPTPVAPAKAPATSSMPSVVVVPVPTPVPLAQPTSSGLSQPLGPRENLTSRYLSGVTASSVLQPDRTPGRYAPEKVADGDARTAWGSRRGDFFGEWFEVRFSRDVAVTSIDLLTGFCTSFGGRDTFSRNRRIKRARFSIGSWQAEHSFGDDQNWQSYPLGSPVTGRSVRVTVLDVYEGSRWTDLHVSEIRVWGHATP